MAKGPNTHQALKRKRPLRQTGTKPRPQGGGRQCKLNADANTLRLVRAAASIRVTVREAAMKFGVALQTFEEFLEIAEVRAAWEEGEADASYSLRSNQFKLSATHPQMAIHLGKIYLGQKEEVHVSGHVTLEQLVMGSLTKDAPAEDDT